MLSKKYRLRYLLLFTRIFLTRLFILLLKRRGVSIREAFNQINRYESDSFRARYGLFEYVQIYVISNEMNTKYYL